MDHKDGAKSVRKAVAQGDMPRCEFNEH